jgi:GntR family transcriptional regulator
MVHLDYRDARPIYTQIVDGFRQQISAGILQVGDKLPSVRELAAELTINPNTIQRAYRELEAAGWIATVAGKGCFVHSIPTAQSSQQQALLAEFDRLTHQLIASGLTADQLISHLREGGK